MCYGGVAGGGGLGGGGVGSQSGAAVLHGLSDMLLLAADHCGGSPLV